jgi:hypothetical protein
MIESIKHTISQFDDRVESMLVPFSSIRRNVRKYNLEVGKTRRWYIRSFSRFRLY